MSCRLFNGRQFSENSWWYIERPFPLLILAGYSALVGIIVLAVVLGIWWF